MSYINTNPIKIYIGKIDDVVICTDEHPINVRTYMEEIRHLSKSQYDMIDSLVDENSYYSFFSRERMEELSHGIILPRRDCEWILNEMNLLEEEKIHTIQSLTKMSNLLKSSGRYTEGRNLDLAAKTLLESIEKKKIRKDMEKSVIYTNEIFQYSIKEYFQFINMDIEMQQMRDQYRYYSAKE